MGFAVQRRNGVQRFESLIRYDVIPTFMALQDHPGFGEFFDMKQQVPAAKTGQGGDIGKGPGLGRKRFQNLETQDVCDRLQQIFDRRFLRDISNALLIPAAVFINAA